MGVRFYKAWGRPSLHTHTFSLDGLASIMRDVGFSIETSEIIGSKTKALYIIGRKTGINK